MATEQSVMAVIRAARPKFRNSAEKVVYAIHACFLSAGYVLNAVGPPAFADDALTSTSSDEVGIDGWNEVEENYAFVYSKWSKKVLIKCLVMNNVLALDGLSAGTTDESDIVHLEINIADYVTESDETNYSSQFKNLGKLVDSVNKKVLAKLDGSSTTSSSTEAASASSHDKGGLRDDRDQPNVGRFVLQDPPYNIPGVVVPPVYPTTGGGDLFPQPGVGMYPPSFRGDFGGGGMLVGPNDPRFFGGMGGEMGFPGGQPGVPPGARFDPFGPPNVPGFEPNRFARNPPRPGGGTHPDLEQFGHDSDFI